MKTSTLSVLAIALSAGLAAADVETQSFSYAWSTDDPVQHHFSFNPFDDMDGSRVLTNVYLSFDGELSMTVGAQTYEGAVGAGEWEMEASHSIIAYFNGGDDGLELLQGLGGNWRDGITGDMGAGAGGQPGTPYLFTFSDAFSNTVTIDPAVLPDFHGTQPLMGFMDGWFDAFVIPPASGQFIEAVIGRMAQTGTVTLTYEYEMVPAPAGVALLGVAGLVSVRRRR